jgi:hypothetical protein
MSDNDPSVGATVAAIEAIFTGRWGVWLSDTGWWWATRTQALTAEELSAGCAPFVHADNPDELTERVRQQERLSPSRSHTEAPGQAVSHRPRAQGDKDDG